MADKTSFLDEVSGQGFEGMGQNDFAIPFLKILQSNSPEVNEADKDTYVSGAKAGTFFNSVTKRIYGSEINLIPIKYDRIWLAWAPERGGLRGRYLPGSIEIDGDFFSEEGARDSEGNEISDTMVFYCLVADHIDEGLIVFSLASSGLKHGKAWNELISLQRLPSGKRAPFFGSVWKMTLAGNKNKKGSWYQIGTKNTNAEKIRDITEIEYTNFIKPAKLMLDAGAAKVDFTQIGAPDKEDTATLPEKDIPF